MARNLDPFLLTLAISLPGASHALGLGEIHVDSSLNQPLSAQIEIVGASPEELAGLRAAVANRDAFIKYGADRPAFLSSAAFKVGHDKSGRPVLLVTSSEAFTEPLVSLVVDLNWGTGELVREYTLMLDPSDFSAPAAAVATDAPIAQPNPPRLTAPAATATATATEGSGVPSKPAVKATYAARTVGERYTVAPHDTLGGIALRAGARSKSHLRRAMIAIYRANPQAFEGNINRLKRGATLELPSEDAVLAISKADAKRELRQQMAAWRSTPMGAAAQSAAAPAVPSTGDHPAAAGEATTATALELRIQSLERDLNDTNSLLAQRHAEVLELQQRLAQAEAQPSRIAQPRAASEAAHINAFASVSAQAATLQPVVQPTPAHAVMTLQSTAPARAGAPAHQAPRSKRIGAFVAVAASVAAVIAAALGLLRLRLRRRPAKATPTTDWDNWRKARRYGGAGAAEARANDDTRSGQTLGIGDEIRTLKAKAAAAEPAAAYAAAKTDTTAQLALDSATDNHSILDIDTVETHVLMPSDLNDQVVVSERRSNAVDVLRQAIEREPARRDLRLKLLELYYSAAATNRQAFLDVARNLAGESGLEMIEEWDKVAEMGRRIASDDSLFSKENPAGGRGGALKDCA